MYEEDPNTSVRKQYIAAIVVSLGTFCHGTGLGWVSPSLETLQGPRSPLGAPLTTQQVFAVASLFCAGGLQGMLFSGLLVDRIGRRWTGLIIAVPYAICYILKLSSASVTALFTARVLVGFGAGGSLLVAPLYCLEIGSNRVREELGSICNLTLNAGVLFAFIIGAYLPYSLVLWINLAITIAYFAGFYFMPESPTYLVKREKYREAAKSIAWLRSISPDNAVTHEVLSNLKNKVLLAPAQSVSSGINMRAFIICLVLVVVQCFVGTYVIPFYVSDIFAEAGSTLTLSNAYFVVGTLQFFGFYCCTLLIERLGRKILFFGSFSILGLSLATLGTYFYLKNLGYDMASVGWIPVAALSIGVTADATRIATFPFVIINEVFMVQVQGIITTFVYIEAVIGSDGVLWAFSSVSLTGTIYTFLCVPET